MSILNQYIEPDPIATGYINVFDLQVQLNRFARWFGVVLLKEDGIVGPKTWTFLKQVAAGFVPTITERLWGPYAYILTYADATREAAYLAGEVAAAGDRIGVDGRKALPQELQVAKDAIAKVNVEIRKVQPIQVASLVPTAIVGGGAALPWWGWGLGLIGAVGVGIGVWMKTR